MGVKEAAMVAGMSPSSLCRRNKGTRTKKCSGRSQRLPAYSWPSRLRIHHLFPIYLTLLDQIAAPYFNGVLPHDLRQKRISSSCCDRLGSTPAGFRLIFSTPCPIIHCRSSAVKAASLRPADDSCWMFALGISILCSYEAKKSLHCLLLRR